jgi:hypothetical protein
MDPLYGEILPEGIRQMLDNQHLLGKAKTTKTIVELGMGLGKGVIQIFYEYENATRIIGIEMSKLRFEQAVQAVLALTQMTPNYFTVLEHTRSRLHVQWKKPYGRIKRYMDLRLGDCLNDLEIWKSGDAFIFNVKIPDLRLVDLCWCSRLMKPGARICAYMDLNEASRQVGILPKNFKEIALQDRFLTSWAKMNGHHFFTFVRL